MGKIELTKIPLFGYFYKQNSIIVDRSKIRESYAAFVKAGEKLDNGLNVCIFPEGGIPPSKIFLKKLVEVILIILKNKILNLLLSKLIMFG